MDRHLSPSALALAFQGQQGWGPLGKIAFSSAVSGADVQGPPCIDARPRG